MTNSVDRLKELLFDRETATLAEISRRLDEITSAEQKARAELAASSQRQAADAAARIHQVEQVAAAGSRALTLQEDLARRIAAIDERLGTDEALRKRVAGLLDDIIIEARETKQENVSRALAPMLVKTIKAELKNNQAEMVEALYPITGQLVKAYVASAMKDLTNRMNRRFQSNAFMLRFRSLFSGYSVSELALAETQQLEVEELYLIRRGSGELLERWPAQPLRTNSDIHMSGVMSAINDFATDAFQTDGGHLRSFNLDDFTVFLRASPVYMLAAKCRGIAAPGVDGLIDNEFLTAVSRYHDVDVAGGTSGNPQAATGRAEVLSNLQARLDAGLTEKYAEISQAGMPFSPVRALVATFLMTLIGGLGWYGWTKWSEESTRVAARSTITETASMKGYPVLLDVGSGGRSISISGVAPSESAKRDLFQRLAENLPGVAVEDRGFAPLPAAARDVTPEIAAVRRDVATVESAVRRDVATVESTVRRDVANVESSVRKDVAAIEAAIAAEAARRVTLRSLDRASRRLDEAMPDVTALITAGAQTRRQDFATAKSDTEAAAAAIRTHQQAITRALPADADRAPAISSILSAADRLRTASTRISGVAATAPSPKAPARTTPSLEDAAAELSLAAERLATTAAAALQTASLRIPPPPTAMDRLKSYVERHAIFFANGDDYRDRAAAQAVVAEIVKLAREAGAQLRVVGYTDERGGQTRNAPLAQTRADKVLEALASAGFPRARLIAVGRATGPDLSPSVGPDSANRRVEFEIGFNAEPGYGSR